MTCVSCFTVLDTSRSAPYYATRQETAKVYSYTFNALYRYNTIRSVVYRPNVAVGLNLQLCVCYATFLQESNCITIYALHLHPAVHLFVYLCVYPVYICITCGLVLR